MIPITAALTALLLAGLAEWLHSRRIHAVARLAFGPEGAAYRWTRIVHFLRPLCLAAFAWGVATLWMLKIAADSPDKNHGAVEPTRLIFVGDLSPSMYIQDAGPDGKQTRQDRMRDVVDAILQRVSGNIRFGVIGFFTESVPVVMEARDPELVRNVFNGLPLTYAMPIGDTDLGQAINASIALVKDLPAKSARLLIFTDGDSVDIAPLASLPASVKSVTFLGLGDPHKGTFIDGHLSRQEPEVLRRLATELKGSYEDVNDKHLSTEALGDLVVFAAAPQRGLTLAELAVLAMLLGAAVYSLIPVALEYFGSDWRATPAEREARKLPSVNSEALSAP